MNDNDVDKLIALVINYRDIHKIDTTKCKHSLSLYIDIDVPDEMILYAYLRSRNVVTVEGFLVWYLSVFPQQIGTIPTANAITKVMVIHNRIVRE